MKESIRNPVDATKKGVTIVKLRTEWTFRLSPDLDDLDSPFKATLTILETSECFRMD